MIDWEEVATQMARIVSNEINGNCSIRDDGTIKYIPYKFGYFHNEMELILKTFNKDYIKFLDVGCGIGDKVFVAREIFELDAYGIEIDGKLAIHAQRLLWTPNRTDYIFKQDALEFKNYNEFDIIYCWRPFNDKDKQIELETLIKKTMKVGAILYAPILLSDIDFTQLHPNIWVKEK